MFNFPYCITDGWNHINCQNGWWDVFLAMFLVVLFIAVWRKIIFS